MTRRFALFGLAVMWVVAAPASAQTGPSPHPLAAHQVAAVRNPGLQGTVLDDRGQPLPGAVVSALGMSAVFTVSDSRGLFAIPHLPDGAYLVRAHLPGYLPARGQTVRVGRASSTPTTITLRRQGDDDQARAILAAGAGPVTSAPTAASGDEDHDHGEVSWRLRHLKRSVLKDASAGPSDSGGADTSFLDDSIGGLSRAVGSPARLASSLLADVPWSGQLDLLTSTSFERPDDLLSMQTWLPRGVAFISLEAPTPSGHWAMRGALTQGDLSSWVVAGSYQRAPAAHRYQAGLSYGAQRYLGGNADALAAVSDGGRNAGIVYAYDDWAVTPALSVSYGAKYARYDYLSTRGLVSPRVGVTVKPRADDSLALRASLSRRALAPGAEEFVPPSSGLSLPPQRTFSSLSRHGFIAERSDHVELAVEREWGGRLVTGARVFRQEVDDQILTVFGAVAPAMAGGGLGHYYVASAGDFEATGWGVSVSRSIPGRVRASVDYTNARAVWVRPSPEVEFLPEAAVAVLPGGRGRLHDITTSVESVVPVTATRIFAIYKLNSGFADLSAPGTGAAGRFDLQFNQSLPFIRVSGAEWEVLVALRSLFRDELPGASMYDELLVVRSPKRVAGGVTVRF